MLPSLLGITNVLTSVPTHLPMMVMEKRGLPIEWLSMIFGVSPFVCNCFYNPITKEHAKAPAFTGVKKGCPLSPPLFSVFIDPLLRVIPGHCVVY